LERISAAGRRRNCSLATLRGRLVYNTLQNLVDDTAQLMEINPPLAGGSPWYHYRDYDAAFFAQDQWRVRRNLSLTYGLRYELPRSPASDLRSNNQSILEAAGGDLLAII
jgi:outer membrane receptor protein involved in Fe transport